MTREELLEEIDRNRKWLCDAGYTAYNIDVAFASIYRKVKELEQEPCEDAISRAELKKWLDMNFSFGGTSRKLELFDRLNKELPSVTPTHIETVTEFADRCRECGKQKNGKWIFTKTIFDKYGWQVECSSCHKKWKTYDEIRWGKENKYCPNCGTEMGEVEE